VQSNNIKGVLYRAVTLVRKVTL